MEYGQDGIYIEWYTTYIGRWSDYLKIAGRVERVMMKIGNRANCQGILYMSSALKLIDF